MDSNLHHFRRGSAGNIIADQKKTTNEPRERDEIFATLIDTMNDIVIRTDIKGKIAFVNDYTLQISGYSREDLLGQNILRFISSEYQNKAIHNTLMLLDGRPLGPQEYVFIMKDGRQIPFEVSGNVLTDEGGIPFGFVRVCRNIDERRQTEKTIREGNLKFRAIFDNASDGILMARVRDKKFYLANNRICEMLGYSKEELLKLGIDDIHPENFLPYVNDHFKKLLRKEILVAKDIPVVKKDKPIFFADISSSPINIQGEKILVGMFRDVTKRKKDEMALRLSKQRYRELSMIDDLTQLYNSRHFYVQLKKETERSNRYAQPLTLLLMDLDKFKDFNDTYGHVEGDYVLERLGRVIKRCLRENDSAYRYGGEEFTIMLPMTTHSDGIATARRIQSELSKEIFAPVQGQKVRMTVSIGVSQYRPKEDLKAFVHRIDQLMYKGKRDGRGNICSDDTGNETIH